MILVCYYYYLFFFSNCQRLTLVWAGSDHELGLDKRVKLLLGQGVELESALLEGEALLVRVLGHLAGHVVANLGVEAGDEHEPVEYLG